MSHQFVSQVTHLHNWIDEVELRYQLFLSETKLSTGEQQCLSHVHKTSLPFLQVLHVFMQVLVPFHQLQTWQYKIGND